MSKNSAQEDADRVFAAALEETGARDPREFYRQRLRDLKDSDTGAYDEAVAYYRETLIPTVASGSADPIQAWLEYGCRLANLVSDGTPVTIDPTGVRHAFAAPVPSDHLLLHLPAKSGRALVVGLPRELSPAQWATFQLLAQGRLKLRPQPQTS